VRIGVSRARDGSSEMTAKYCRDFFVALAPGLVMARFTLLFVGISALACSASATDRGLERTPARVAALDTIPLDSCAALDHFATAQQRVREPGEVIPEPHSGSWADVRRLSLGAVSIDVPNGITLGRWDSTTIAMYDFPTCRFFCALSITLVRDSASRSLDAYAASLRAVDTAADPNASRDLPGPPRPLTVGPERGLLMTTPCGDCTSSEVVVTRAHTVAHIGYSIDDRDGYQPGVMCRLTRAATSFRWIDAEASISTPSSTER
jgi:hypothetical protein